ncbi:hypothetical protein JKP88DRAFT_273106 [Tribonema minus]|uniref:F-box domain-containing protein n=1 Tax=Tribonema minus TaxID=303371 RepID=A0A836CFC4_9STRA|nr:hypothetical protein JKP88DRAFT_273106 [Tribonema minus]
MKRAASDIPATARRVRRLAPKRISIPDIADEIRAVLDFVALEDTVSCMLVCKVWRQEMLRRHPQLAVIGKLNSYQRKTLHHVKGYRVRNVIAMVDRKCAICSDPWRGGVNSAFGIPAHPACVRDRLVLVRHLPPHVPVQMMLSSIPNQDIDTYRYGVHTFKAIWKCAHDAIPRSWTLEGFMEDSADAIHAVNEARRLASEERMRMAAERRRVQEEQQRQWADDFKTAAAEARAPLRTIVGLKRLLPPGLIRRARVDSASETARRGLFLTRHFHGVPQSLWSTAFDAFDDATAIAVKRYADEIEAVLWPMAFAPGTDPRPWREFELVRHSDVAVIRTASQRGLDPARALRAILTLGPRRSALLLHAVCRDASGDEGFEGRIADIRRLGLCTAAGDFLSHCDFESGVRSYAAAKEFGGDGCYERWGDACFRWPTVAGGVAMPPPREPVPAPPRRFDLSSRPPKHRGTLWSTSKMKPSGKPHRAQQLP